MFLRRPNKNQAPEVFFGEFHHKSPRATRNMFNVTPCFVHDDSLVFEHGYQKTSKRVVLPRDTIAPYAVVFSKDDFAKQI